MNGEKSNEGKKCAERNDGDVTRRRERDERHHRLLLSFNIFFSLSDGKKTRDGQSDVSGNGLLAFFQE